MSWKGIYMEKIVILGAGPTGLGAAYRLTEMGYRNWQIVEKNDHVGGLSASFTDKQGFVWDIGGHVIFSYFDRFNEIVKNLLGDNVLFHDRESWIWLQDQFVQYPFQNNFHHHADKEMVLECVLGLLESSRGTMNCKNFKEWIDQFFGDGIAKYFMVPYNQKVWKYPLHKMDYNWIAERVSLIDLKSVLSNIILQNDDSNWGPNNTFSYPLTGGIGGLFNSFLPFTHQHIEFNKNVTRVDGKSKKILFEDGTEISYDLLVSTIPLNELIGKMEDVPDNLLEAAGKLVHNRGFMVGIGINKKSPSNKNWMYFPQDDAPFYRVTYLSNYSPNMAPKGDYFSFLAETSHTKSQPVSKTSIIEESIQGLINSKLLKEEDRSLIVSTYLIDVPHSLPVPFVERDKHLKFIQAFLEKNSIFSRGRFGGWKYEIGNMDHSVMQGIEVIDRVLLAANETIYRS